MNTHFTNRWKAKEPDENSIVNKIKNVGQPQENLKSQIQMVTQRLDTQVRMLDGASGRFQTRDQDIFNRIVKAMAQRDQNRANILATELAEIRKIERMLSQSSLALQSMSMRLSTVSELGDVVAVLGPAKGLLNGIRTEMCGIFPEASNELGSIGNLLNDICAQSTGGMVPDNPIMASADAMSILEEAEVAAASRLKDRLPEIGLDSPLQKRTSLEI